MVRYTFKVDTLAAITDQSYFTKAIDVCEKLRQEEVYHIFSTLLIDRLIDLSMALKMNPQCGQSGRFYRVWVMQSI